MNSIVYKVYNRNDVPRGNESTCTVITLPYGDGTINQFIIIPSLEDNPILHSHIANWCGTRDGRITSDDMEAEMHRFQSTR